MHFWKAISPQISKTLQCVLNSILFWSFYAKECAEDVHTNLSFKNIYRSIINIRGRGDNELNTHPEGTV